MRRPFPNFGWSREAKHGETNSNRLGQQGICRKAEKVTGVTTPVVQLSTQQKGL